MDVASPSRNGFIVQTDRTGIYEIPDGDSNSSKPSLYFFKVRIFIIKYA
jgi:hypothetical protein